VAAFRAGPVVDDQALSRCLRAHPFMIVEDPGHIGRCAKPETAWQVRKIAGWAVMAFIAYYLYTPPAGAAGFTHNVYGLLTTSGGAGWG
jgi:hypothetical protein